MRDVVVALIIFGSLPLILWRPHIGVLMWTWIAFMNPHRLTWGFAYDMQFALMVGLVTLVSMVITREQKNLPLASQTVVLALFVVWMMTTTIFAAYPDAAREQAEKVAKIFLMVFVTMMLMKTKERINLLIWVMTLSLAFYGVKGGIFTVITRGDYRVWGPGGFIGGNNEIALALLMTVPLLYYLACTVSAWWARQALYASMVLCAISIIGSHSRGAFVGIVAMAAFLWLKSQSKAFTGMMGIAVAAFTFMFMPEHWFERMGSIQDYDQDMSAIGRLNAWQMAINLASSRPLGGGFEAFQEPMFLLYAPNPSLSLDAHSIYFEILGEHGFVGLALFLALGILTWHSASLIIRQCRSIPEKRWAAELAAMVQVSLVGYATAGAFLGLAYFDLYYTLIAVIVLVKALVTSAPKTANLHEPGEANRAGNEGLVRSGL